MTKPRIGNAPVSWAVYEAHLPNPPFGSVLDAIAAAGYEGTELGPYGYLPTTKEALALGIDRRMGAYKTYNSGTWDRIVNLRLGVSALDDLADGRRRSPLEELLRNIRAAAFEPAERDACYRPVGA